jgi:DNA gyrase/topoisomerase IV subunit A
MALNDRSKIVDTSIESEMKTSYIDYSMSVIVSRALPDVRDGLKPSQRRILVAMNDLNLAPGRPYRKCAKIAGDTSGQLSPARRAGGLPHARAPRPGLGDALPAGGRARELRLD